MPTKSENLHPGIYIKESLWPENLTVTDAAERMQVGRPALSNLLNGNSSLSLEMAVRLEILLGRNVVTHQQLLKMQSEFDQGQIEDISSFTGVRAYVESPSLIRATHLEDWFRASVDRRSKFPAFLRHLVYTTGIQLIKVDFPAYDESQRHGWDGEIEAGKANPWIPEGYSGWEFGTTEDYEKKVNDDYNNRLKLTAKERKNITFVFVTPFRWAGAKKWAESKRKTKQWKDVRVYDANALEQWLEQSIATQAWIGEQMGTHLPDISTLEDEWRKWVCDTKLSTDLYSEAVEMCSGKLSEWLEESPDKPFRIEARSIEEGLSFLYALLESMGDGYNQKGIVARSPEAVSKLKPRTLANFIPVLCSSAEKVISDLSTKQHTFVIGQTGTTSAVSSFSLKRPTHEPLKKALVTAGIDSLDADDLIRKSGRSPTILRRLLTENPAIKVPSWEDSKSVSSNLPMFALIGKWNASCDADREILRYLYQADDYDTIEQTFNQILSLPDSPLWRVSSSCGVVSKIDALFAVRDSVTEGQIKNFFFIAELVLSEEDPSLDLPEEDRWMAAVYKKVRQHSDPIRKSICDTLVLLSVVGEEFFGERLSLNVQGQINHLISRLLEPFDEAKWLNHNDHLPEFAEAAPDMFLEILDEDLKSDNPKLFSIMQPVNGGITGGRCYRTGLLWGLEAIAWRPDRLIHVTKVLAELSKIELDDNWLNKPINSLKGILCSWMPQTAAKLEERTKVLKYLCKKYPLIGWELCIEQFTPGTRMGDYSYRPHWREDAKGVGEPLKDGRERIEFEIAAVELALNWPVHSAQTLGDLIERLQVLGDDYRTRVWEKVTAWISSSPSEEGKAELRERIRRYALTRRGVKHLQKELRNEAKHAYKALEPRDLLIKHSWLFKDHWLVESIEEIEEEIDYDEREKRVRALRVEALKEVYLELGQDGLTKLISDSGATYLVGRLLPGAILDQPTSLSLLVELIQKLETDPDYKQCIQGILETALYLDWEDFMPAAINRMRELHFDDSLIETLIGLCPFNPKAWGIIEDLGDETKCKYWKRVSPCWVGDDKKVVDKLVKELLNVGRPSAIIQVVHHRWEHLSSRNIQKTLKSYASTNEEASYKPQEYEILSALKLLHSRADLSLDDLAALEFQFLGALRYSEYEFPNLGEHISRSPEFFSQVIALQYKRAEGKADPDGFFLHKLDNREDLAHAAYTLLGNIKKVPGTMPSGEIHQERLLEWITETRKICSDYGRLVVADHHIGRLLTHAPHGSDGVWPCEPVREVLEEVAAKEIAAGIKLGFMNSKGVREVVAGMKEDCEESEKFMQWSHEIAFEHPYVSKLLKDIAEDYLSTANSWEKRRRLDDFE
ncbi:addiction module antidote protein, HigA family [Coraliomargarita sinensis]|uniref:Addiction module antidote protein, HigA family n=1 Tax=Coraliomargarita sinensis TaxID=2174842 RepID=A0A317ZNF7_9BACT|nr:HigA family addiction module antitoxin [Coraliomargarita sinensis]PXA05717.1 addiction module antidote protein, HigA family [Coraliomargarita sinensis]